MLKLPSSINGKMPSLTTKGGHSDGTTNSEHFQSTVNIFSACRVHENREETRGRAGRKGIYELVPVCLDVFLPARRGGVAARDLQRSSVRILVTSNGRARKLLVPDRSDPRQPRRLMHAGSIAAVRLYRARYQVHFGVRQVVLSVGLF